MRSFVALLFYGLLFSASNLSAQESENTNVGKGFKEGAMSLSVGIPGGGNPYASGTAGIWYGMSDSINLGINVGLGIDTATQPDATFNLLLAPTLKFYLIPDAEVSPFVLGQLNLSVTTVGDDAIDLGILGGFGAEWFVTHAFSVAAYTGLGIDILRPGNTDPIKVGTLTSGLSGQIYW